MFEGPEKKFQRHIADYLIREHQYALLEQDEIIDTENMGVASSLLTKRNDAWGFGLGDTIKPFTLLGIAFERW